MTTPRTITRLGFAALACAPLSVALGEGSELPDGSVTITALPFFDTGDTTDNLDDYDAVCPWASDSPDVFYTFTVPPHVSGLELELCRSDYDTKVYVLDEAFNVIACDDDGCGSKGGGGAFRSMLFCSAIPSGETIHIAIDGWSGDAGTYELSIEACKPSVSCDFNTVTPPPCPPDALIEDEPCSLHGPDVTNGGCRTDPEPRFQVIDCDDTFCGSVPNSGLGYRDFDWFEVRTPTPRVVTMTVVSESIVTFGHVVAAACPPGAPTCDCVTSSPADPTTIAGPCRSRSITVEVPAGRSWWWIRTVEDILPCDEAVSGNEYVATWTCVDPLCCTLGDSNLDGTIDFADLIIMLSNWGPCPD